MGQPNGSASDLAVALCATRVIKTKCFCKSAFVKRTCLFSVNVGNIFDNLNKICVGKCVRMRVTHFESSQSGIAFRVNQFVSLAQIYCVMKKPQTKTT